jgi:hypothetical protein
MIAWNTDAMASGEVPPHRPRRERPLVAAGRERRPEPRLDLSALPPPGSDGPPPDGSKRADHVWVSFTGPMAQKRVTVVFRFVLAVPHLLWMVLLGIAWEAVAFIAWFAALFTGRVPAGMAQFLGAVVQYQARVTAYGALLMTDEFPPFDLYAPDAYAVNVHVSPRELNRLAVLFRFVLMVPSALLSTLLFLGAQVVSSVTWLLTLVVGRTPTPLWEANAAVLRYQTRAAAFASMLTAEQPGGALGDRVEPPRDATAAPPRLPDRPRIFRLALSVPGRRLVVLFGVVAVVFYASFGVIVAVAAGRVADAQGDLEEAHARLEVSLTTFADQEARCPPESLPACLRDATEALADAFDGFAEEVAAIEFGEFVNASLLVGDADACASALRRMSAAPTSGDFQVAYLEYRGAYEVFDDDYRGVTFDVTSEPGYA